jgi:hypothetical protein
VDHLILDSGALISGERDDREFALASKTVQRRGGRLIVPAPVLAQVWRGGRRIARLAHVLKGCVVVSLDEATARVVGELCAATATKDIVDATVAVVAHQMSADVATSDPADVKVLLDALGASSVIMVM